MFGDHIYKKKNTFEEPAPNIETRGLLFDKKKKKSSGCQTVLFGKSSLAAAYFYLKAFTK